MGKGISRLGAALLLLGSASVFCDAPRAGAPPAAGDEDQLILSALRKIETEEYRISSQDVLDISVYREEDLTREARVAADGKIGFPLIGQAKVAGLTVSEAEERLGRALATYLVHPQVTVQVKEYHARKIYVLGEVKNPGAFQLPSDQTLTVVETIALAGGLTKTAASNRTRVVRQTGGKVENFVVPVADVTKGDKGKDLVLQPGDVVFVPQAIF